MPTPPPLASDDEADLVDQLLGHLDSQDATVQTESANLLNEMDLNKQADKIEAKGKLSAKERFKLRQVRSLSF